ncbi:MAG TPA: malto-oligosyltrehalose synthase [Terriglobales bacterium]|jgi:(1->4)-alpha-D-glucan 1-alpha-D-glucosylmutase|nr:malto-oligosyltrehalose synthase [Terriglobales bacterium]
MKHLEIPRSTYRLQFNRGFTFSDAIQVIPYLAELGISHCYASPYLRARPGSLHGYDIVDHRQINPEIGTPEEYERFVAVLHEHGLGQILDIVPNHMGIMGSDNAWWLDVLENGEASAYADFFDIDWYPLKGELQGKVLVPVLGDQYGTVLDRGELTLAFDQASGEFSIGYFHHRFPIDPREYPRILSNRLAELEDRLGAQNEDMLELQSLITAFEHLPIKEESSPEKRAERMRDKEIHKRRLASLCSRAPTVSEFLERTVEKINGSPGDTASFDQLHELIKKQAFRLAYWRVAADDINYRRFFDVNDLAALRQEDERVFEQTHECILRLLDAGKIDGLRIDHPDGLFDPQQYFARLQQAGNGSKHHYIVAEKILTHDEQIPGNWPIDGTTGYNFLNLVNGLFVEPASEKKMNWIYRRFIGENVSFEELAYQSKKLVIDGSLNSELNLLANDLSRIALSERHTCDFTLKSLRDALTEIVALFPVYRTYSNQQDLSHSDRAYINQALNSAIVKNSAAEPSVYEFIRELLLRERLEGRPKYYQRAVVRFAMRFQQYTSALMAKGLEDTSFYRYNCLVSLNEVGGNPLRFGVVPEEFHRQMAKRRENWPHEMSATSTHDTKRSEDVRARIDVLSEMPLAWHRHVRRWRQLNRDLKTSLGVWDAPDANDEYLLYQTLVGAWPFETADLPDATFIGRISEYMRKAMREAKSHTNWANPNEAYEKGVIAFIEGVLRSGAFFESFISFQRDAAYFGMLNSLSETLIKLTAPGVPDIYQGAEVWDFSLVDPDNRRPVDYKQRFARLQEIKKSAAGDEGSQRQLCSMTQNMQDGRIKLHTIAATLRLRREQPELFRDGEYLPLSVSGDKSKHLVAFARRLGKQRLIVGVPRLSAELLEYKRHLPCGIDIWQQTRVELPDGAPGKFQNAFTGERVDVVDRSPRLSLSASDLLSKFPVALLMETS